LIITSFSTKHASNGINIGTFPYNIKTLDYSIRENTYLMHDLQMEKSIGRNHLDHNQNRCVGIEWLLEAKDPYHLGKLNMEGC